MSIFGVVLVPIFTAFGLNTEKYFVSLRFQSKCGKNADHNNSKYGHILRSVQPLSSDFLEQAACLFKVLPEAVTRGSLYKKLLLKFLQFSHENTCVAKIAKILRKPKRLQHRCFPCKHCENFKNTYLEEHL